MSSVKTYLNNTWLPTMDTLNKLAVEVKPKYFNGTEYVTSSVNQKVFLLSYADLFDNGDAREFTYTSKLSIFNKADDRICTNDSGDAVSWLLRSSKSNNYLDVITDKGYDGYGLNSIEYSVRPALWVTIS